MRGQRAARRFADQTVPSRYLCFEGSRLESRQRRGQPSWAVSSSVESANAMTASDANSAANVTRSAITNCFGLRQGKDLGQKQTFVVQNGMSALPPKADMCAATRDVR